jgi:hypothetical protein
MIPIIFIHNQNSDYLPLSLWQARKSNPETEVILIGDSENAHFKHLVTHVDKRQYLKKADEFAKKFVNFSTNSHDFELICLQRWFILEEFLRQNNIEKCLYLDSDILLFGNVKSEIHRFRFFGMTIAGISGHSNYINDIEVLSEFCQYIEKAYESPEAISILEEKYKVFRETHEAGGISDMTFFVEFKEEFPDHIIDIGILIQGKMYDISMNYIEYMHNTGGIKIVNHSKNGEVFLRHAKHPLINMQTLHFQGDTKVHMKRHLFTYSFALDVIYYANKLYILYQKTWKKTLGKFFR